MRLNKSDSYRSALGSGTKQEKAARAKGTDDATAIRSYKGPEMKKKQTQKEQTERNQPPKGETKK
jgi:hypothetical protein